MLGGNMASKGLKRFGDFESDELSGSLEDLTSAAGLAAAECETASNLAEALEKRFLEKRDVLIGPDGVLYTPLKVLKDMAYEYGVPVESTTFEIHLPTNVYGFDSVRNRVLMQVGPYSGMGETNRHRMAKQLAAADLLEKVKKDKGEEAVGEYGLLPGCRTSPMIYEDLRELCRLEKLASMPVYTQLASGIVETADLFSFRCAIGLLETVATSDSIFLAKRLAAKEMYEKLTNEKYPDDHVAHGSGCLRDEDLRAMGISPVVSARVKQRNSRTGSPIPAGTGTASDSMRGPAVAPMDDIYDDDFAEEEDNVVLMREQLEALSIRKDVDKEAQ